MGKRGRALLHNGFSCWHRGSRDIQNVTIHIGAIIRQGFPCLSILEDAPFVNDLQGLQNLEKKAVVHQNGGVVGV